MAGKKQDKKQAKSFGYDIPGTYMAATFFLAVWAIMLKLLQKVGIFSGSGQLTSGKKTIKTQLTSKPADIDSDSPTTKAITQATKNKQNNIYKKKKRSSKRNSQTEIKKDKGKEEIDEVFTPEQKAPTTPLLKFSILPERDPLFSSSESDEEVEAALQTETKETKEDLDDVVLSDDAQKRHDRMMRNIEVTSTTIPNLIKDLTAKPSAGMQSSELGKIAVNLAFIYRFHRLSLAIKSLTGEGEQRELLYNMRTDLVHNISHHLLDDKMLDQTREGLANLDLSELNHLNPFNLDIQSLHITKQVQELELYKAINQGKHNNRVRVSSDDANAWIRNQAIPLLNSLHEKADSSSYQDKSQYYDAIRLMIIMVGEHCPAVRNSKANGLSPFKSFIHDCRLKRNAFAHVASPHNANRSLDKLLAAGKKVNGETARDRNALQMIAPKPSDKAVNASRRTRR